MEEIIQQFVDFIMNFIQSKKIEDLHKKVIDLSQELSIIKSKQNDKKQK